MALLPPLTSHEIHFLKATQYGLRARGCVLGPEPRERCSGTVAGALRSERSFRSAVDELIVTLEGDYLCELRNRGGRAESFSLSRLMDRYGHWIESTFSTELYEGVRDTSVYLIGNPPCPSDEEKRQYFFAHQISFPLLLYSLGINVEPDFYRETGFDSLLIPYRASQEISALYFTEELVRPRYMERMATLAEARDLVSGAEWPFYLTVKRTPYDRPIHRAVWNHPYPVVRHDGPHRFLWDTRTRYLGPSIGRDWMRVLDCAARIPRHCFDEEDRDVFLDNVLTGPHLVHRAPSVFWEKALLACFNSVRKMAGHEPIDPFYTDLMHSLEGVPGAMDGCQKAYEKSFRGGVLA